MGNLAYVCMKDVSFALLFETKHHRNHVSGLNGILML